MIRIVLAEFPDPDALIEATRRTREAGLSGVDTHTPFKVEGIEHALGLTRSAVRTVMLIGGLGAAAFAFLLQYYSAVFAYPLDLGGRPLNSWQTFLIPSFEFGVLVAAFCGVVALLWSCGLPRPHHPLFAVPGFERASQDRFFLSVEAEANDVPRLRAILAGLHPVSVSEVEP